VCARERERERDSAVDHVSSGLNVELICDPVIDRTQSKAKLKYYLQYMARLIRFRTSVIDIVPLNNFTLSVLDA
jgi:hypothetical protein